MIGRPRMWQSVVAQLAGCLPSIALYAICLLIDQARRPTLSKRTASVVLRSCHHRPFWAFLVLFFTIFWPFLTRFDPFFTPKRPENAHKGLAVFGPFYALKPIKKKICRKWKNRNFSKRKSIFFWTRNRFLTRKAKEKKINFSKKKIEKKIETPEYIFDPKNRKKDRFWPRNPKKDFFCQKSTKNWIFPEKNL